MSAKRVSTRLSLGVAILVLGACSNVGRFNVPLDDANVPSVQSIIQEITCELAVLSRDDYQYKAAMEAGDYVVGVQLELIVNDDGSLAPSFTYMNGMTTMFSFNAGAKLEVSREQEFIEQLFFSIKDLKELARDDIKNDKLFGTKANSLACPEVVDTPLASKLGIVESVHMAMNSTNLRTSTKLDGSKGAFGGYVYFVVTKNLNAVGPTYTLTHFKGPGSLAGVSEVNTDKLTFAFAPRNATGTIPGAKAPKATPLATAAAKAQIKELLLLQSNSQISTQLSNMRTDIR